MVKLYSIPNGLALLGEQAPNNPLLLIGEAMDGIVGLVLGVCIFSVLLLVEPIERLRNLIAPPPRIDDNDSRWIRHVPEREGASVEDFSDTVIYDFDGISWHEAPVPRRLHRCRPQTYGLIGFSLYVRCACGAISPDGDPWLERNSRRKVKPANRHRRAGAVLA